MLDLVLSENKEIISRASNLGYKTTLKAVVFQPKNLTDFKHLNKLVSPETLILGSSQDDKLVRRLLEDKRVDGIVNIEPLAGREHTHYRRSNLNQVLAKIAYDKDKFYCIDFSHILRSKRRHLLLGRIMQNVRILQKYKVPITIASFSKDVYGLRSKDNLDAFARVIGVRKITAIEKLLKNKQYKLAGKIVRKGIKVLN